MLNDLALTPTGARSQVASASYALLMSVSAAFN